MNESNHAANQLYRIKKLQSDASLILRESGERLSSSSDDATIVLVMNSIFCELVSLIEDLENQNESNN